MANYSQLKAAIADVIKTNGTQAITGQVLQDVLNSIVSVIGANYTFAGVATPATNPSTPDQNVVYMASQEGTYTNFNGTVLPAGIHLLMWNGSWSTQTFFTVDNVPTAESENFVKSGGVDTAIAHLGMTDKTIINSYIKEIYIKDSSVTLTQVDFAIASYVSTGQYAGKYLNMIRLRTSDGNKTIYSEYCDSEAIALTSFASIAASKIIGLSGGEDFVVNFSGKSIETTEFINGLPVLSNYSDLSILPNIKNWFQDKDIIKTAAQVNTGYLYKDDISVTPSYINYTMILTEGIEYIAEVKLKNVLAYNVTIYVRRYPNGTTTNITSAVIKAGDNYARLTFKAGETNTNQHRIVITNTGQNAYDAEIKVKVQQMTLKVLLVGSSYGVNTISMFPVLAKKAGVDITCGSLYYGSCAIGLVPARPLAHHPSKFALNQDYGWYKKYTDGKWSDEPGENGKRTYLYALQDENWDVIIMQRGAEELRVNVPWSDMQTSCLQQMIEYTRTHCDYEPEILFADGLANPVGWGSVPQTRESQIAQTEHIISTAQEMKSKFGINVIPVGVALQNARLTLLSQYGYHGGSTEYPGDMACDSQHLDAGIGYYVTGATLFEYILKPKFGLSIMNLDYLPVVNDVKNCWVRIAGIAESDMFHGISVDNINIAKYAVLDAIVDPLHVSTTLSQRYSAMYNVTQNLTNCKSCFQNSKCETTFFALITPDSGKVLGTPVITMGGNDVTSTVYSTVSYNDVTYGVVSVETVTGDIVITMTAS